MKFWFFIFYGFTLSGLSQFQSSLGSTLRGYVNLLSLLCCPSWYMTLPPLPLAHTSFSHR